LGGHRDYGAKSILRVRDLRTDFVPPGSVRSLSNLTFDQRDGFFPGPEFLASANGMRIRLVILVDLEDPDSWSVGW